MNDITKEQLIDRIVREVMYRIGRQDETEPYAKGAVVLMTSHVPGCREAVRMIEELCGADTEYIGFGGAGFPEGPYPKVSDAELIGPEAVSERVHLKEKVILLAPKLVLLEQIAQGSDEGLPAYLMIRSLLWGKDVSALLDFEPPRFKRNTFFERVVSAIETLEDVGIGISTYRCVQGPEEGMLALVTERDVVSAAAQGRGRIRKTAAALVTPAAKDAARELGIVIDG